MTDDTLTGTDLLRLLPIASRATPHDARTDLLASEVRRQLTEDTYEVTFGRFDHMQGSIIHGHPDVVSATAGFDNGTFDADEASATIERAIDDAARKTAARIVPLAGQTDDGHLHVAVSDDVLSFRTPELAFETVPADLRMIAVSITHLWVFDRHGRRLAGAQNVTFR